ncbi:sugar kinase [Paenibacillus sp. FSL R5-0407]|uniref:carbohydrate kinase family protein n=1 Tax=Paenibacillus sp. FSL R5-0407 TaxID=2975320 RepID=UPI0030FB92E3
MIEFGNSITLANRKNDLLAIGELLIDMISAEYGDHSESSMYHKFFGGSPANIVMNTKKLGINSRLASAVGVDGLGSFLLNRVSSAGVDTDLIQQVEHSTSMVVVTKSQGTPIPIFYRDADYRLSYTAELDQAVKNSKIIHFSCWPVSRTPVRHTMEEVIKQARAHDCLICFDPNYHHMLWEKDEDGIEYIKSLIGKVDIVKPSEDDAERLFGKDSHLNQIDKFLSLGAKLVIMTLGREGAIVSNGQETIQFDTLAEQIVDTTGAGDAFWSGFYSGLVKGYTLQQSLNLGFAVSAYKLKFLGAVIDLPQLEEIRQMYSL